MGDEKKSIIEFRNAALVRLNMQEDGSYKVAWTIQPQYGRTRAGR